MGCIGFIYEGYDDMTGFFFSFLLYWTEFVQVFSRIYLLVERPDWVV
jgi:hypothetical protein